MLGIAENTGKPVGRLGDAHAFYRAMSTLWLGNLDYAFCVKYVLLRNSRLALPPIIRVIPFGSIIVCDGSNRFQRAAMALW
jgi:hypothetical protein